MTYPDARRLTNAVIVDAVRSPMGKGKPSGSLAGVHPVDLLAQVLSALVRRQAIDPGIIDDVLVGCVGQVGEQSATPGRQAVLAAGFPIHVPSVTIERKCGSSQQAIDFAIQGIQTGNYDVAIAAGVESMSRVPMGSARVGADPFGEGVSERFPLLVPQGVSAELMASQWGLTRRQLDAYAARSHQRAAAAREIGDFKNEIVSIITPNGERISLDETIRADSTAEALGELRPAFYTDELARRFPHIEWKVTAGNSSQITDGASALLIMSEERCEALGLTARARIVASAVVGDDPLLMLTGPIPATHKVLNRAELTRDDLSVVEINEAFAPVPLAWQQEFPVSDETLNPVGGAIALGHPLGASGCRLATTMINQLERVGGRYGLQAMCEAGGMANATIFESLRIGTK